eukprot:TRINITY_DN24957_c0_g1_i1.p1 TRINITY_DN24957_c0_g1~~TRINITY_DN24957_c0_g1_i1.p1  ORF type:complete len:1256 (+),score=293.48 TRINITY_DN24957_c0_g1_i1:154-3921(+)
MMEGKDGTLCFPVYDLLKVLRVDEEGDGPRGSGSDAPQGTSIVHVVGSAHTRYTLLAVLCSNNAIVLRFVGDAGPLLGLEPRYPAGAVMHVITYFTDQGLVVSALALSPGGSELLVTTVDGRLYIVPAATLLFPSRVSGDVNHPTMPSIMSFLKADSGLPASGGAAITHVCNVDLTRPRGRDKISMGFLRDAIWWRAQSGNDYAVVACSVGFIAIVDLARRAERRCFPINIRPHSLHLCHDSTSTSLLITGKRGMNGSPSDQSTCVLLEFEERDLPFWHDIAQASDNGRNSCPTPNPPPHQPVLLPSLNSSSASTQMWTAPLGRGRDGVLVFQSSIQEVSCFDASLTPSSVRNPLYVFHVGPDATHVHLTSGALLYAHVANGHQKIAVLSRFAAGAHPKNRLRRGVDSGVLQEILLPGERVQGFTTGGVVHDADEDSLPVETVIVWTANSVYELVPGARTPTELFTDTILHGIDPRCQPGGHRLLMHADSLAKAYQLNIIALYERCADTCREQNMRWALQLYKRTDIRPDEYVRRLARYGGQEDLLKNLLAFLRSGNEDMNAVLFYTAMHCMLLMPRSHGIPSTPRFKAQRRSLSRLSLMSIDSDDMASRGTSSVKSAFARSNLRELASNASRAGASRAGDAASQRASHRAISTRASAQATASANDTLEVSTAKTNEDDSYMLSSTYHDMPENETTPDPMVALSSCLGRMKRHDDDALAMMRSLVENGMVERAAALVVGCGLVVELLDYLRHLQYTKIPAAAVDKLVEGGHAELLLHSYPTLVPSLPPHAQLVLYLSTISNGDSRYIAKVAPLLMQCARPSSLYRAYGVLKLFSVELCVLALLRLAQLTEAVARRQLGDGLQLPFDFTETAESLPPAPQRSGTFDSFDLIVCEILRKCNGEWSPETVRRYAGATERWRVASAAAGLSGDPETAVLWHLMWVHKRFHPLGPLAPARRPKPTSPGVIVDGRSSGQSPGSIEHDVRSDSMHHHHPHHADMHDRHAHHQTNKALDISMLIAAFLRTLFREPFAAAARRRCLRMVLEFYETAQLPVEPLVATLQEASLAEDVFQILIATPACVALLPVPYLLSVAKGFVGGGAAEPVRAHDGTRPRGNSTSKMDVALTDRIAEHGEKPPRVEARVEPEEMKPSIVIPPQTLHRVGKEKEKLLVFTCGHPAMPVSKFAGRMMDLQSQACPITASALRATADRIAKGMCHVTAQGCPKCVAEALKIPMPPCAHKESSSQHKAMNGRPLKRSA